MKRIATITLLAIILVIALAGAINAPGIPEGCQEVPGFQRCSIRKCVIEKGITTCAECDEFASPRSYAECKKINNLIAKVFALIFRSDRPAALALLRDEGREVYLEAKRSSGKM